MPITKTQLAQRRNHIGSSDMAAILGLSPYRSAWDVWAEKTGRVEPADLSGRPAVQAGNLMEVAVLDYAADALGALTRNQYRSAPALHLGANCDAILRATGQPVEAKTSGLFGPLPEAWGEGGTDQVPDPYIVQVHVQMLCTGAQAAHLAAFLGGRGFELYHVALNADLAEVIAEAATRFWALVETDTPPENATPALETLARLRRVPQSVVEGLPADLLLDYEAAHEAVKNAEALKDSAKAEILRHLGDAEAGVFDDGRAVTYYEVPSNRLDVKALQAARPDVCAEYMRESAARRMTIRKKGL